MVSVLSVSSTKNLADDIDAISAKVVYIQDQITVLQRGIGQISGSEPSIEDSIVALKAELAKVADKVDKLSTTGGTTWNQSTWGQAGYLSLSMSPQKPRKGDYFTIMVYDLQTGKPAAGAMVQGPGLLSMTSMTGMMYPGMMPSFGFAVADAMGVVYGQWQGGRASFTARSQDGKFGSLTIRGGGGIIAWVLAIMISLALVFSALYVYYRREMGLVGMSV